MNFESLYNTDDNYSPLELLFSAYTSDRLPQNPDTEEKQRDAYLAGLRTGFRLALELQGED